MNAITIRPALEGDLERLVQLNAIIQHNHVELEPSRFRSNLVAAEVTALFAGALSNPTTTILIAEADGAARGYIWFERQERPETPLTRARFRFYVHHVVVDVAARRLGIASALFERVEAIAREAGARHIALDAWSANADAQAFFAARGFTPISVGLEKHL